jgi:hypothetical protein
LNYCNQPDTAFSLSVLASRLSCKPAAWQFHNPFPSPADAFRNYSKTVDDFEIALIKNAIAGRKKYLTKPSVIHSILLKKK